MLQTENVQKLVVFFLSVEQKKLQSVEFLFNKEAKTS